MAEFVKTCDNCQRRKTPRMQAQLPHMPAFEPSYPFQYLAMDITELLAYDLHGALVGHQYILVFLDMFTKWVEYAVFSHAPTADDVVKAFLTEVFVRHGAPEHLVSDNGPNVSAQLVKDVIQLLGAKSILISPYRPQSNGQVERVNRTLK